jgi:hypothetical protein
VTRRAQPIITSGSDGTNVNSASRETNVISVWRGSLLRKPITAFTPPKELPTTKTLLRPVVMVQSLYLFPIYRDGKDSGLPVGIALLQAGLQQNRRPEDLGCVHRSAHYRNRGKTPVNRVLPSKRRRT